MFDLMYLLIALSLGTNLAQFEQVTGVVWPLFFFERPLFLLFEGMQKYVFSKKDFNLFKPKH